ncbi:MAG: hypothetical protein H7X80_01980, partial [bacterium]|nr:hypothetical protein [Candidatus Kapabacteria bacterium]
MKRILFLFSSAIERDAALPDGLPDGVLTGVCGIGLVEAGIGTTRMIHDTRPDAVVFLGTCGAYRSSGLVVGDVVVASTTCLSSGDVARGEMRIPSLVPTVMQCDVELATEFARR